MTFGEFLNNIAEYEKDRKEHFIITVLEQDEVSYANQNDCNIEYCHEHNIPVYDRKGAGGTIVHSKGSVGIDYIYSHDKHPGYLSTDFIMALCQYLKCKGINAEIERNDILVDGYKVCGCAENNLPPDYRWCNIAVAISVTQNLELIKNVCLKPMKKVPKALEDYGITTKEIVDFANNWFKNKRG